MTIILCAIHSQYIHSALAPWYLKAAAEAWCRSAPEVRVLEGTINQPEEELLRLCLLYTSRTTGGFPPIWTRWDGIIRWRSGREPMITISGMKASDGRWPSFSRADNDGEARKAYGLYALLDKGKAGHE